MILQKIKITTKLIIASGVFLLPILIMITMIILDDYDAIHANQDERYGVAYIRPVVKLFQSLSQHLRITVDFNSESAAPIREEMAASLKELEELENQYGRELNLYPAEGAAPSAGKPPRGYQIIHAADLRRSLDSFKNIRGNRELILNAYFLLLRDLYNMISYIGDTSKLMVDPELGNYYLAAVGLQALPRIQERNTRIGNFIRMVQGKPGGLSPMDRRTLQDYTTLLGQSDHPQFTAAIERAITEIETNPDYVLDSRLPGLAQIIRTGLSRQETLLNQIGAAENPAPLYPQVLEAAAQVNDMLYQVWTSVLDQLDHILEQRIQTARSRMIRSIVFAFLTSLAAFSIIIFITWDITASIKNFKHLFTGLEQNDLAMVLKARSKDEFGELMAALNHFLEKLRTDFTYFNQDAAIVSSSVFDLSASAKEITTTANEQSASVAEIVSTMEGNKNLSEQVALKTAEVAELTVQTQELSRKGAELRDANQDMMEAIRLQNGKIINEIKNLTGMITRISEAIGIIDGIADQTKLIAFNASLEASSSGEAGARFSVVASEIRRFADNVVDSTGEIKRKIEEVQAASHSLITEAYNGSKQIDQGYERMVEQKEVFENIVENSQNAAARSQQISNLSKQQEQATAQIFATLKEISAGIKQFVTATASTSKIADNLNSLSAELRETSGKYKTEREEAQDREPETGSG